MRKDERRLGDAFQASNCTIRSFAAGCREMNRHTGRCGVDAHGTSSSQGDPCRPASNPEHSAARCRCAADRGRGQNLGHAPPRTFARWLTEARYAEYAPQVAEHIAGRAVAAARRCVLDRDSVRHRRPARHDVSDRQQRHQRPHDGRKRAGTGRLRAMAQRPAGDAGWPARSPTTRGIARAILPSCAPRSWWRPASRSISSTAFAARPSCRSPCGIARCRVRHHDHGQPQSAQRQRHQSLLVSSGGQLLPPHDQRRDRSRDERDDDRAARHSPMRWPTGRSCIARKKSTRSINDGSWRRACPARGNLKIIYSPMHGVGHRQRLPGARRRRVSRTSRCSGRRPNQTAIFRTCRATSRIPKIRRTFDVDHRPSSAERRRAGPVDRSRLPTAWVCAAPPHGSRGAVADLHGQPDRRAVGRVCPGGAAKPRAGSRPSITSSRRWSRREMIRRIADAYGVKTFGDLLVGFK